MKQKSISKKIKIKIIAICFFAAVLILTFFSNTIMNASLPEITAQYAKAGMITEKISSSGIVTADQTMNIYPKAAGTIAEITVQNGDTIKQGDLLCTIQPESGMTNDTSGNAYENAYYAAIQLYLQQEMSYETAVTQLNKDKAALKSHIDAIYQLSENAAVSKQCAALQAEQSALEQALSFVTADSYPKLPEKYRVYLTESAQKQEAAERCEEQAQKALADAQGKLAGDSESQQELVDEAFQRMDQAYSAYLTAHQAWQNGTGTEDETSAAWAEYENCTEVYQQADKQLEKAIQAENAVDSAEQALETAQQEKKTAARSFDTALDNAARAIKIDQYLLTILQAEASDADVHVSYNADGTVPVYAEADGTVVAINASVGDAAAISTPMLQMVRADTTYTLRILVSSEKAQDLQIGTEAVVINADASAILKGISPSAQSGNLNEKELSFAVTGDVESGQTLVVKMNEKSQNYDLVVPSRAISEDSKGTFVFVVQTRSTPLGNRYSAKRVNIEVLADDGTNAAVSGELDRDSYVICLSTEAIQAGDMVRMKETAE